MRKPVFAIFLILALVFMVGAQAPQRKAEDVEKNLVLVDKPQSAPEEMKVGLETITEDSALGMLAFMSSDLLEGRDTATRGYMLAAEYVASLFKVWGIEPAGDMPQRRFRFFRSGPPPPAPRPSPLPAAPVPPDFSRSRSLGRPVSAQRGSQVTG